MYAAPRTGNLSTNAGTLPEPLPAEPFGLFVEWLREAERLRVQPNPNAMSLATVARDGRISSRIVLCKGVEADALVFFTNYDSRKGRDLGPAGGGTRAAAVFHWDLLDRQARFEGTVERVSTRESDDYYRSRPWISQVGAWASRQSTPIASRAELITRFHDAMRRFGLDPANPPGGDVRVEIPRPDYWGGYRLKADRVELWMAAPGRLHDRAAWTRAGVGWDATRLMP